LEEQAATAPAEIAHKTKARVNRPYMRNLGVCGNAGVRGCGDAGLLT
jgi:hypothetical protein